jgi:hypothetical protein
MPDYLEKVERYLGAAEDLLAADDFQAASIAIGIANGYQRLWDAIQKLH